jgi:outer membrane receptor protein involved in Fe transport
MLIRFMRLAMRTASTGKGVLLTAGVENLFNRFYREHLDLRTGVGVYEPGLNGYFGVEMRY